MNKTYQIRQVESEKELQDALSVRRIVFIDEQQVPEDLEIDEHDTNASPTVHFVAYDGEQPVGAGRLRPYAPGVGKVERVAVLASERGTGLGRQIMLLMEESARTQGFDKLKLNAQCHAQAFYEKLGYIPVGDVFDEAGIPHIAMEKSLK
jgi:predicted GNAT family N-acyltransferase